MQGPGMQIRCTGTWFRDFTLYFTSMPATKSYATPIFSTPNHPPKLRSEQIGGSPLGSTLGAPGEPQETPRRPPGAPRRPQKTSRRPPGSLSAKPPSKAIQQSLPAKPPSKASQQGLPAKPHSKAQRSKDYIQICREFLNSR